MLYEVITKQENKRESFELFTAMLDALKLEVIGIISKVQVQAPADVEAVEAQRRRAQELPMSYQHPDENSLTGEAETDTAGAEAASEPFVRNQRKVGRNEPCPCGSGKKYKQCHA